MAIPPNDGDLTIFATEEKYRDIILDFVQSRLNTMRSGLKAEVVPEFSRNDDGKVLYSGLQKMTNDI